MASPDVGQFAKEVQEFKEITGADDNIASQMIHICNGDLQMAINMHVDGGGIDIGEPVAGPPPSPPLVPASSVNIGASSSNGEYVRPPLPPKQEVLVESFNFNPYGAGASSGRSRLNNPRGDLIDPFRDLEREALRQEEEMERGDGGFANLTSSDRKASTLEDLFRPPLDLMFKGPLEAAREEGKRKNKWILVNVVNLDNFQCQTLNRDVWREDAVRDIVKRSFVFWQVYHKSDDYINYNRFYPIDSYPHVAVLDPRTGERLVVWSKLDVGTFLERVTDFLTYCPCPDQSREESAASGTAPPPKKPKSNGNNNGAVSSPIEVMDEDEQLKAAIAASLEEASTTPSESYTKYLGAESDPKSELMFRYPDGERKVHSFPSSSKLRALTLFAHEQGFSENSHELVTNYPRRNLSECDSDLTLSEVGLFPKETVFIQLRSA